jgi:hypothetical protein
MRAARTAACAAKSTAPFGSLFGSKGTPPGVDFDGFGFGATVVVTGTVVDVVEIEGAIVVDVEDGDEGTVVAVGFSAAPGLGGFKISAQLDGTKNCAWAIAGESSNAVPVAVSS